MKHMYEKYLELYKDFSFDEFPLTESDLVLLSIITYIPFEKYHHESFELDDAFGYFYDDRTIRQEKLGLILPNDFIRLYSKMIKTKRFKDVLVTDIKNILNYNSQFFACLFHVGSDLIISVRGTDDSIAGWIENLRCLKEVPVACIESENYVNDIIEKYQKNVYIIGHSKGGQLAFYGAVKTKYLDRVIKCYSFDGPGFVYGLVSKEELYNAENKLYKVMPHNSIVGMVFNEVCKNITVYKAFARSLFSHNPLTWRDKKVRLKRGVIRFKRKFNGLIYSLTEFEREQIVDQFLELSKNINAKYLRDLFNHELRVDFMKKLKKVDKKYRKLIRMILHIYLLNH